MLGFVLVCPVSSYALTQLPRLTLDNQIVPKTVGHFNFLSILTCKNNGVFRKNSEIWPHNVHPDISRPQRPDLFMTLGSNWWQIDGIMLLGSIWAMFSNSIACAIESQHIITRCVVLQDVCELLLIFFVLCMISICVDAHMRLVDSKPSTSSGSFCWEVWPIQGWTIQPQFRWVDFDDKANKDYKKLKALLAQAEASASVRIENGGWFQNVPKTTI